MVSCSICVSFSLLHYPTHIPEYPGHIKGLMNTKWVVDWEKMSVELVDDHHSTDSGFINSICKKIKVTEAFLRLWSYDYKLRASYTITERGK